MDTWKKSIASTTLSEPDRVDQESEISELSEVESSFYFDVKEE